MSSSDIQGYLHSSAYLMGESTLVIHCDDAMSFWCQDRDKVVSEQSFLDNFQPCEREYDPSMVISTPHSSIEHSHIQNTCSLSTYLPPNFAPMTTSSLLISNHIWPGPNYIMLPGNQLTTSPYIFNSSHQVVPTSVTEIKSENHLVSSPPSLQQLISAYQIAQIQTTTRPTILESTHCKIPIKSTNSSCEAKVFDEMPQSGTVTSKVHESPWSTPSCDQLNGVPTIQDYSVPFSGSAPYGFIQGYEEFFKVNPMTEVDMIQYVMQDFEGEALERYYQYVERKFLDTWTPVCWEDIVSELYRKFVGENERLVMEEEKEMKKIKNFLFGSLHFPVEFGKDNAEDMKGKESAKLKVDLELLIEEAVLSVRHEASDDNLLELLKLTHGLDKFRDGQLEAIKMVLAGKSAMLVLPTGAGKSLCYQLAALVLPGITLVVSPLVALMIYQLKQLPPVIPGGLLSSSQTRKETQETLRLLQEGALKVLFVLPERFLNSEFTSIFSASALVSLAVVNEAHCISEWSHNFRPSYMRLRASLLCVSLNVESILAMTATATRKTLHDVMSALEIPPTNLIQAAQFRENFQLSVSISGNRMKDLTALLRSSPFAEIKSIIIYCKYQYETDTISKFLSDGNIMAKSYHSGIPAKDRSRTQELFCANKIRVVVATVAFGMGLDKRNVGAVIHYSLPESSNCRLGESGSIMLQPVNENLTIQNDGLSNMLPLRPKSLLPDASIPTSPLVPHQSKYQIGVGNTRILQDHGSGPILNVPGGFPVGQDMISLYTENMNTAVSSVHGKRENQDGQLSSISGLNKRARLTQMGLDGIQQQHIGPHMDGFHTSDSH